MELRFLGHTYTSSLAQVSTHSTGQIGNFRGQTYYLRRPSVDSFKPQLGLKSSNTHTLKYRGVVYSI